MTSGLWADDLALSLKRSLPPTFTLIAACGVAKFCPPRRLCLFTVALTATFLAIGLGAEVAAGTFLSGSDYRFAGTLHPNDQGVNCALLCLASMCLAREKAGDDAKRPRRLWLFPCLAGAAFLFLTGSRTAIFSSAAAAAVFWLLAASRYQRLLATVSATVIAACVGVIWLEADADASRAFTEIASMGREQDQHDMASLTGRVPIWREVLRDIGAAPLFGYGYGAFWTPQRVLYYSYVGGGWEFTHAHSAYFESLLNVGAMGLVLGLYAVLTARRSAVRTFRATGDPGLRFVAIMLTMALVHGLLDSNFIRDGLASTMAVLAMAVTAFHGRACAA
jgi:O-antigen ligase